ncbi:MAG: hypothetical protein HRU38_17355 [Saccharospirillaceae bacterium]|nr:hypothetical protein [Saccharospirillaceae bacterium]
MFTQSVLAGQGYATRYWDGCKAHCSWSENSPGNPVKSCNLTNQVNPIGGAEIQSGCDGGDAYTCWDMSPIRVSDTLSYGYAAVPSTDDICGVCYELTFTGQGKYNDNEPGSMVLKSKQKKMIVMATNIGHDVAGGQFDILIPGGGVGAFNACSTQWQVSDEALGAQYGGFLTACQADLGYNDTTRLKSCVQNSCDTIFSKPGMEDLKRGCDWYVDWFEMADNPKLEYKIVACPAALISGAYDVDSPSNTAPVIHSADFSNGVLTANASDEQSTNNELTFTWMVADNTIAMGASVSAPDSITGIKMVVLIVSDGQLSTQKIFTADFGQAPIEVNTAPVIHSAVLSNGFLVANATDTQSASNELVFTWMIDNNNIGRGSTITAPNSITGTKTVTVTVSDGELSSTKTFNADFGSTPNEVNTAPVIQSAELINGYLVADASDEQSTTNELDFTWMIDGVNVAVGPVIIAPTSITGTQNVTLIVSDGELSSNKTFIADFGFSPIEVNTAPVIHSAVLLNGLLIAEASDTQSPTNTLSFTWVIDNNIVAVNAIATAPASMTGTKIVTLLVSDGQLSSELSFNADFGQAPIEVNTTPVIHSAGFSNGYLIANATDTQSTTNTLTFTWMIDNNIIAVGATATVPTEITGTKTVTLTVSDGELSSQKIFTVNFAETNSTETDPETSQPANPAPSNTTSNNSTSSNTSAGLFGLLELFALFTFVYIRKRKLV